MNKAGFTLLETLCYIAITTILVAVLFRSVAATTLQLKKVAQCNAAFCQLFAAHQLLERDLLAAPEQVSAWKQMSDSSLIWQEGQTDRGWLVKKNQLLRVHGVYNSRHEQWTKKVSHVVARGLDSVQFRVHKQSTSINVVQYQFTASGAGHTIEHTVHLNNRVI